MKLLIVSDIHGDLDSLTKVVDAFENENADKILLLGDLIYHGPRNDLPPTYNPKQVINLLNEKRDYLLAVRGNCDTEVDQMVLDFPILADYALLSLDGLSVFATHGHHHNTQTPPPLREGEILLHGHTHVSCAIPFGNENLYINPGSASIPKENTPRGYIIIDENEVSFKTLDGSEYKNISL
jgi:putative phosphoesterase